MEDTYSHPLTLVLVGDIVVYTTIWKAISIFFCQLLNTCYCCSAVPSQLSTGFRKKISAFFTNIANLNVFVCVEPYTFLVLCFKTK